jgi:hypothetical protein
MSTPKPDDLEAVRTIADTLKPFPRMIESAFCGGSRETGMLQAPRRYPRLPRQAQRTQSARTESRAGYPLVRR